jgi:RNA polymerase primary sigma factor
MSALITNIFEDRFEEDNDNDSDNVLQFRSSHSASESNVRSFGKRQSTKNTLEFASKTLTAEEEKELIARAKKGDLKARNELTLANMKLVASIARKYEDRGIPLSDLLQEGSIGLMSAVNKFDPKMGHRFSTYAAWWVREAITRSLSNKSRLVRLPVHLNELMTKVRRVRSSLAVKLGRQPLVQEIASELNESVEKIEKALNASQTCMSLDQKVSASDDEGFSLGETIMDEDSVSPIDRADAPYFTSQITGLLSCLNDRERQVIRMRFGMDSGEEISLREIAEKLGLTRDQVGKISCIAMRKLKKAANRADFEDYLAA